MKPLLIAHRGGKGYGVENTKEAFLGAIKQEYDGIECDIQPDINHELIVSHDLNLKRLGNKNINIKDVSYNDIKDIILTKTENNKTLFGTLLRFDDLLDLLKDTKLIILVEIKESCEYIDIINAYNLIISKNIDLNRIYFISNYCCLDILIKFKKEHNDLPIKYMFIGRTNYELYLKDCLENNIGLDACVSVYQTKEGIEYFHLFKSKKLLTNAWCVNTIEEYLYYKNMDIDIITTDILNPKLLII